MKDEPWIFRTYAGHSTAAASNALFRANLATGQTGLSIAFDLPTQTGYDADHPLAAGEVGKVGVPVSHLGDMRALFEAIPLERMNTSMTINATAAWLLALYIALAEERGDAPALLQGTTQNDIIKEYLARGTHIFPPAPSMRLIADMIAYCYKELPKFNPVNVCSYHLQEAGATPAQELSFALATACAVLDSARRSGQVTAEEFPAIVGRISFFVNAGIRFIEEMCKMRAFAELWDEICETRYGVTDAKLRRLRYGVQVNSLGLTEQQPENNIARIAFEMLAVTLSKDARARAVQLPAWNEALGLPRPWDQQWSLRLQQILAYETDLLEYEDVFAGSPVIAGKVESLKAEAREEFQRIDAMGGALKAVESGHMKQRLVESNARRIERIESGELKVIGVNAFTETAPSPLPTGQGAFVSVGPEVERAQIANLEKWRAGRDAERAQRALQVLARAAADGDNIMPPSIECAKAGVTTGEWAGALRRVFGEYRAPTGISGAARPANSEALAPLQARVNALSAQLGRRVKFLVAKPGLDGHSNGAEQVALRARDIGIEVVYDGIRFAPSQIIERAQAETVDVIGLSVLSGSHVALAEDVMRRIKAARLDVPVVIGGIVPAEDQTRLKAAGIARIYTPKDFKLNNVMSEILALLEVQPAP